MKEATGELNMTVVTVVAITAVMGFFYLFIWPSIQNSLKLQTACSAAGNTSYSDPENGITCTAENGEVTCSIENGPSKKC